MSQYVPIKWCILYPTVGFVSGLVMVDIDSVDIGAMALDCGGPPECVG